MPDLSLAATPASEDFANALLICDAWASPELSDTETAVAFQSVAGLVRRAMAKLGVGSGETPQP